MEISRRKSPLLSRMTLAATVLLVVGLPLLAAAATETPAVNAPVQAEQSGKKIDLPAVNGSISPETATKAVGIGTAALTFWKIVWEKAWPPIRDGAKSIIPFFRDLIAQIRFTKTDGLTNQNSAAPPATNSAPAPTQ